MSKYVLILIFISSPFYPVSAEEFTTSMLKKSTSASTSICDKESSSVNASIKCELSNDDQKISLINQAPPLIEETYEAKQEITAPERTVLVREPNKKTMQYAGKKIILVDQQKKQSSEVKTESQPELKPILALETTSEINVYSIQERDTIYSITRKYFNGNINGMRVGLANFLALNKNITLTDKLNIGQKIIIPGLTGREEKNENIQTISIEKKLTVFFDYRFNYISVKNMTSLVEYNFNTAYDLEGGIEYQRKLSSHNYLIVTLGVSDCSIPLSIITTTLILNPSQKTLGLGSLGIRHEFSENNSLSFNLNYRPYYFLTATTLEYELSTSGNMTFENHFYDEKESVLGFTLGAEAISAQNYANFKSENGSVLSFSLLYRQDFLTKNRLSAQFYFQQRSQKSTFYKMNDKGAGLKFSYTYNFNLE